MRYHELEPIDRDVLHLAQIACVLANVNRDAEKRPKAFQVSDFLMDFARDTEPSRGPTWQEMKAREQAFARDVKDGAIVTRK